MLDIIMSSIHDYTSPFLQVDVSPTFLNPVFFLKPTARPLSKHVDPRYEHGEPHYEAHGHDHEHTGHGHELGARIMKTPGSSEVFHLKL